MGPSVLLRARGLDSPFPVQLLRATGPCRPDRQEVVAGVGGDARIGEEIIERVAALDIGKAEVVCCVRVPGRTGASRRVQEVTTYSTMTRSLWCWPTGWPSWG